MENVQSANITSMPVEEPKKAQARKTKQDQIMAALNELKADADVLKRGSQNSEREIPCLKLEDLDIRAHLVKTMKANNAIIVFCGYTDHFCYG